MVGDFFQVIDGGSTGSRLHVFEFVTAASDDENDTDGASAVTNCVRRGSARANVPLSAFAPSLDDGEVVEVLSPRHVAEHLLPAFEYAATVIPPKYYNTTLVTYQATAGMRLLTDEQQEAVYDALYEGLRTAPEFVFHGLRRSDIQTLSGELEGFYGAVAANYLKGTITADLELVSNSKADGDDCGGPLGALDMGGSSTQIVFLPSSTTTKTNQPSNDSDDYDNDEQNEPGYCLSHYPDQDDDDDERDPSSSSSSSNSSSKHACHVATAKELSPVPRVLKGEDFFATSYLSYGVDQFRERLWNTWVQEARAKQLEVEQAQRETEAIDNNNVSNNDAGRTCSQDEGTCNSNLILNPCAFRGYIMEWDGFQLIGTGQAEECVRHVQRLIPHPELPWDPTLPEELLDNTRLGQHVGGMAHPPVRGKFLAMSLYFFTLDSLRELTRNNTSAYQELNRSWPTPSIQELHNALEGLCARGWADDLEPIQHSAHAFTRPEVLPHRCLESVYLVTLLKDGFGFAPESRDITFTFLVDGSEVEWSLGMALALRAQRRDESQRPVRASSPSSSAELFGDDLVDFSATMYNESSDAVEQPDTTADNYADDSTSSFSNLLYRMVDQLIAIKLSFPLDDLV